MSSKSLWISLGARTPSSALWILLVLAAVGLPGRSFAAGPYFVKADATGANNGASWANAFTDLQNALAVAQSGDEIWVAAGTYKPIQFIGTLRTRYFVMTAGVAIYGGFAGTETTRDQRNWAAHETILSGDIGVEGNISDNSYHVVVGNFNAVLDGFTVTGGNADDHSYSSGGGMINDSVSPTVTNCTFRGNKSSNGYGGGMHNSGSSPTVTNCTFIGNTANYGYGGGMDNFSGSATMVTHCIFIGNTASYGGGMYNFNSSPTVTHCTFTSNSAGGGGGMANNGGSPTVTNCTFSSNTSAIRGGGMYNSGSSPTVNNCTFSSNTASDDGDGGGMNNSFESSPMVTRCTFNGNTASGGFGGSGGGMSNSGSMYGGGSSPKVTNCTFSGNTATGGFGFGVGGGMINSSGSPAVTNCTFSGNTANGSNSKGGGMYNTYASPTVTNCILWENSATTGPEVYKSGGTPTFRNCDIRGSGGSGALWNTALGTDGGGNIMADPRYVDAVHPAGPDGIWMTADDGLRLQADSSCINKGNPNGAPATDILGNPRSGLPDIGAYEYHTPPPPNAVAVWAIYD